MKKHKKIIIVDDDQLFAGLLKRSIDRAGFRGIITANATDAIDAIDDHSPIAIILDVYLPGVNGIALLHELRGHGDLSSIPVILCTNSAQLFDEQTMYAYGIIAVLDKATMLPGDAVSLIKEVCHG